MIKTKYMFSEAKANKAKDTTSEAKAKDLAFKAKDLAPKAKDMTSCPRGQGHGLEDSISDNHTMGYGAEPQKLGNFKNFCVKKLETFLYNLAFKPY